MDKREGWLAGLKVGDKVFVHSPCSLGASYDRSEITKITPTGRIYCGNMEFDPDGSARGYRSIWGKPYLIESTVETVVAWKTKRLRLAISNWARNSLGSTDLAVLEAVWNAIQKEINANPPSKLINGLIPAGTTCPFEDRCDVMVGCVHEGKKHKVDFSCAIARGFDMIK